MRRWVQRFGENTESTLFGATAGAAAGAALGHLADHRGGGSIGYGYGGSGYGGYEYRGSGYGGYGYGPSYGTTYYRSATYYHGPYTCIISRSTITATTCTRPTATIDRSRAACVRCERDTR